VLDKLTPLKLIFVKKILERFVPESRYIAFDKSVPLGKIVSEL
jgi:hypothetical protein